MSSIKSIITSKAGDSRIQADKLFLGGKAFVKAKRVPFSDAEKVAQNITRADILDIKNKKATKKFIKSLDVKIKGKPKKTSQKK
jgi:hypothetical protein